MYVPLGIGRHVSRATQDCLVPINEGVIVLSVETFCDFGASMHVDLPKYLMVSLVRTLAYRERALVYKVS